MGTWKLRQVPCSPFMLIVPPSEPMRLRMFRRPLPTASSVPFGSPTPSSLSSRWIPSAHRICNWTEPACACFTVLCKASFTTRNMFRRCSLLSCAAGQGCVRPTVTRTSDDSLQPWVVWPTEADGMGTLIISAAQGPTTLARITVDDADVTSSTYRYQADLGCHPAATLTMRAFLDDNGNAEATATFSSDYLDSCLLERQPTLAVQAGAVNEIELALNNSCD